MMKRVLAILFGVTAPATNCSRRLQPAGTATGLWYSRRLKPAATALLGALGLWYAAAEAAAPVLVVHLKPGVTVVDPVITIGDVAVLADGTAKLHEAVSKLDLVELGVTEATMISRSQVAIRMQLAGFDPSGFRITGAERVQVMLDRAQVSEASIVAAARQAIRRKLPGKGDRASLKLLRSVVLPQLVLKPGDHIYLSADWAGAPGDEGPVEINVAVTINGKRQATVPVLLDLGISAAATAAKSEAKATAVKATPAPGSQAPKADNNLPQGSLVSRANSASPFENPVVIRARDAVKLIAQIGVLRVTVAGEALQEGRAGQTIRVRNVDSQKTVLGRVVDAGLVEIDF